MTLSLSDHATRLAGALDGAASQARSVLAGPAAGPIRVPDDAVARLEDSRPMWALPGMLAGAAAGATPAASAR